MGNEFGYFAYGYAHPHIKASLATYRPASRRLSALTCKPELQA